MQQFIPHLWFEDQAEQAAKFYTSVFKDSQILHTVRVPKAAEEAMGKKAGSVMTVEFELNGQRFVAFNGRPVFTFNESVSFMIPCADQKEVDYYWQRLSEGGEESVCGWLKDRFGLSWQVAPERLSEMMADDDPAKVEAVTRAFMQMKKMDVAALEEAYRAA